jgi:glycogen debranching enzyme
MLKRALEVNPNIYIVAELFTGSDESNAEYMRQTGIHAVVVEASRAFDNRIRHRGAAGVPAAR